MGQEPLGSTLDKTVRQWSQTHGTKMDQDLIICYSHLLE